MELSTNDVFLRLNTAFTSHKPFALLRYGDGEGIIAKHAEDMMNIRYRNKAIKDWGCVPSLNDRNRVSRDIIYSLCEADIIGFPNPNAGGGWSSAASFFLEYVKTQALCNMEVHINLHKEGLLAKLCKNRKVFYISCRDVDDYIINELKAKQVYHKLIPEQHLFARIKPRTPLFKKLNALEAKISTMNLTGTICLLGGGTAGKKLGILMKQRGGVVVDIGSVFDLWVKKKTRTWIKKYD
jgi:hypothetical protein